MNEQRLSLSWLLFSFKGRIRRTTFWGAFFCVMLVGVLALVLDYMVFGETGFFYAAGFLLSFYPSIAVHVKRCHDRNHSGWFFLLALVPLINIWYIVEIGFLPGTNGPNRFGGDSKVAAVREP